MSFQFDISEDLRKALDKLAIRDRTLAIAVRKKIVQIVACDAISIARYKNLTGSMKHLKRVHIGSFVLIFSIKSNKILFESLRHHDESYLR